LWICLSWSVLGVLGRYIIVIMPNPKLRLSMVVFLVGLFCLSGAEGRILYVDCETGSDSHNGASPGQAWKSLERANREVLGPDDQLLLKAGCQFIGQLAPTGSGAPGRPVVVDSYGPGSRPLIAAAGRFPEALRLRNQEYWVVQNLELTNTGPTREPFRYGVRLIAHDFGTMHHIHLKNLYIHDVNGSLKKSRGEGQGIVFENGGTPLSRFDDLLIQDCTLVRTDRNGICGYTPYPVSRDPWFPNLNVVIRGNLLEDIGGDAIKPWGCDGALIEHNVVRGARTRCEDYAAGIWPWLSDNTLIQYNEVSGVKGTKDGQAFDSDGFCHHTVFQYNYSHDNEGGFMLLCGKDNIGTVIRYNISQNDRTRLFHFYDLIQGTRIYNNTFYVGESIDLHLFEWTPGGSGWAVDTLIANNVFHIEGTGRNAYGLRKKPVDDGIWITEPGFGGATGVLFQNNFLYGGFEDIPEEWREQIQNPLLQAAGTGGHGFQTLDGYRLKDGSTAIGAGITVPDNGGRDFWGNILPDRPPSVGAHEPSRKRTSRPERPRRSDSF
jgi:hypothetical protein